MKTYTINKGDWSGENVTFQADSERFMCEEYGWDAKITQVEPDECDDIGYLEVLNYTNWDGVVYEITKWNDEEEWTIRDDDLDNYTISRESKCPHTAVMQFICNVG
jgi:hypothetical protein